MMDYAYQPSAGTASNDLTDFSCHRDTSTSPSQLQHARGRPLGDLTWLSRRLGTSGKIWLSTLPSVGREGRSLSSGALRVLPRAALLPVTL